MGVLGAIASGGAEATSVLKDVFTPVASGLNSEFIVAVPAILGLLTAIVTIVWGIPLVKKIVKQFIH